MKKSAIGALATVLLVVLSLGLGACSGQTATTLPTAPATAAVDGGAMLTASHHDGGSNGGQNNGQPTNGGQPNQEMEVSGIAQAVTGTCPALHLTVSGRSVSTNAATEFKHVVCAGVAAGQRVEVKGTLQTDGSVMATRLQADGEDNGDDNENNDDNGAEVKGMITAETGACPALVITVGTATVRTTAATAFQDGACSALIAGTMIEAKGTRQADGSLLASRIQRSGDN